MKRAAALFLVTLCVFNWGGYHVFYYLVDKHSAVNIIAQLDKHEYAEGDLIEMSIPLELPYQNDQDHFERTDGDIRIGGQYYHYVERKVTGNRLVIKCIPNERKSTLLESERQFSNSVNDVPDNLLAKKFKELLKKSKKTSSDYQQQNVSSASVNFPARELSVFKSGTGFLRGKICELPDIPPELSVL